jgi:hypothetical protein
VVKLPLNDFNTAKTDITSQFARIIGISADEAKELQSSMNFEDYYDLMSAIHEGDDNTVQELYNKYSTQAVDKEQNFADKIIDILKSTENADSKKRKILNILNNMKEDDFLKLGHQLYKTDKNKTINALYNIVFGKFPSIGSEKDHILKIYDHIRGHKKQVAENLVSHPFLRHIFESRLPNKDQLLREGFNYYASFENQDIIENLLDWLEDNKYKFLVNDKGHFDIQCEDRERAYKLGGTIAHFMDKFHRGNKFMRDSTLNNKMVEKMAKDRSKVPEAKKQPRKFNPAAAALSSQRFRPQTTATKTEKEKKADKFDRKAKHKPSKHDVDEGKTFTVGETVIYEESEVEVAIASGPLGSVGVILDGKLTMVESAALSRVDENIIGFSSMPTITRLQELAGLAPETFNMAMEDEIEENKNPRYLSGKVIPNPYKTGKNENDPRFGDWCFTYTNPDGMEETADNSFDTPAEAKTAMREYVQELNSNDTSDQDERAMQAGMGHGIDAYNDEMGFSDDHIDEDDENLDDEELPDDDDDLDDIPSEEPEHSDIDIKEPEEMAPASSPEPIIDQSDNFKKAVAMLDEIHQLVTEMKLSEYKIFVQRLGDFAQRIQRLGRDYLR